MIVLDPIRVGSSARGTFGVLRHGQVPFVLTLERPRLDNQQRVSEVLQKKEHTADIPFPGNLEE